MINKRVKQSDSYLNVGGLFISGAALTTDEFKQTLLLDGKPLVIPASNQYVLLPSEIGLQPPNFFLSIPYTGLSLYEEYLNTDYIVTGWEVYLGESGSGPAHLTSGASGQPIWSPLTGQLYVRSPLNPSIRSPIANFYINSGEFASSGEIFEDTLTGNQIIGIDIYSGLSGAEDFSVILRGRYNDLYEGNISEGVVMSSGDSSISFYSEYGATGNTLLEYYLANEFYANRWAVYVSNTGSGPFANNLPLTGRFYYRDPKGKESFTISNFGLNSGQIALWDTFTEDVYIPFRKMVGIDISGTLNDIKNVNIVLGGRSVVAANFYKDLITRAQFEIFSGYATGLIAAAASGVSMINGAYEAITLTGASGVRVEGGGWPNNIFTIINDSGNFNTVNLIPQANQPEYQEGRFYYNNDTKTFDFYLDNPDVTLNLGQEEYIRIVNKTTNTIFNGTPVYISGAQGNRPKGWPALGSENYHINHLVGLATHDILNNEEGFVTVNGVVNGVNTNLFSIGDVLYLGETGNLVNTPPVGYPSYAQIGYALSSQNNGKILISIRVPSYSSGSGVVVSGGVVSGGNVAIKDVTTSTYDFISGDIGKMICFSGNYPQTGVIKSGQGFNVGDYISIMQLGTGELTISGSGITLSSRDSLNKAAGQFAVLEILQKNTDFWILYGDMA
jgi:hypothetical protein